MYDLRQEVAKRMREAMHGKEIDMVEGVRPQLPHMLGITQLDEVHDPFNEEGTLLDPSHGFWQSYDGTVKTRNKLTRKVKTAIHSLKQDDYLRMTYPYGEEAEVVYVEVDVPENEHIHCPNCGEPITFSGEVFSDDE